MLEKSDYPIREAMALLKQYSIEASYLVPTELALNTKSIIDAIKPLRSYLKAKKIHDYDSQKAGPEHKILLPASLVQAEGLVTLTASLYRPMAKGKGGDPRIWFSNLKRYVKPYNLLAILAFEGEIFLLNMSDPSTRLSFSVPNSPVRQLLKRITQKDAAIADELLDKLRIIHDQKWIRTVTAGDTGVGATLESLLGIAINSSKNPDYKGIELKSKRISSLRAQTRSNLFARVADWDISELKSSSAILEKYGYMRDGLLRLNCTVTAKAPNSQGLFFHVDVEKDLLNERFKNSERVDNVATWRFEGLRESLMLKHSETFWVGAATKVVENTEHFHYKKVIHTKSPYTANFSTLCQDGVITMDHLIKRKDDGRVSERGPLFKINERDLSLLFPPPVEVDLGA